MTSKKRKNRKNGPLRGGTRLIGGLLSAAAAGIVYSRVAVDHDVPLPEALAAERRTVELPNVGRLSYYVDTAVPGTPLVLIHSINAAASAIEMKPLFNHYRQQRPVYALDMPGYGFSDRADRTYTAEFFAQTIQAFLDQVVGQAADVVGLSLSNEFMARAALAAPASFRSLTMISPSGFTDRKSGRATEQAGRSSAGSSLYRLFSFPLWSQALFDLIASRLSVRFYLSKSFVGDVPEELTDYGYATSHQPGAKNVPLYFISGQLFTQNALDRLYRPLSLPVLILYDQDFYVDFDLLPELLADNEQVRAVRIVPTLGLPHWEQLAKTIETVDAFWSKAANANE
ncbi:MAG: alpha/beta hydrolase [Ardenticatenaceae bacterium]|nr:alpha/beta hydrolase [Ardenticatenaceae bacterium]MCB8987317.1 alpha/beta hydrolase [Ardenticatenaceae bacterium]